ncbi:uncharacterized protein PRCAT00005557001 [Priceomyces carsonii]|uniref:uncharacterized protein n=1 Tax=Priceomyces carsonii TaxID=28549 RepID=UPI002EDA03A7|nr:unnamed protein product [Priceomyces carsonii]
MPVQFVKSTEDFDGYLARNNFFVANFTALWCPPCQVVKPVIDQLYADENGRYAKIEIARVDLDSSPELASRYHVTSIPTFIFFEKGKETSRINGANIPEVVKRLDQMSSKASNDVNAGRHGAQSPVSSVSSVSSYQKEISKLIPSGFEILNSSIEFPQFEALNSLALLKTSDDASEIKNLFRLDSKVENSAVISDADSQLLFYVPFVNISKVYSILIKIADPKELASDKYELNEDELKNETQSPSLVKVWFNQTSVLSFDDSASDSNAPHIEKIDKKNGWYECKLKFVRFQSVQNLKIFIDGENEDFHTLVQKIIIVGVSGESKDNFKLEKSSDE